MNEAITLTRQDNQRAINLAGIAKRSSRTDQEEAILLLSDSLYALSEAIRQLTAISEYLLGNQESK